jgi:hypothetical protein
MKTQAYYCDSTVLLASFFSVAALFFLTSFVNAQTIDRPLFKPASGDFEEPVTVTLSAPAAGGVIRYTLDGTVPTLDNGQVYSTPIGVIDRSTISAVLFFDGRPPSPVVAATYVVGTPKEHPTFHVGNSLTRITGQYPVQERTAGYKNIRQFYDIDGGLTKALWNIAFTPIGDPADKDKWISLYSTTVGKTVKYSPDKIQKTKEGWDKLWPTVTRIDDFTLQPRDFDIAEEADFDNRWLDLVLKKAPNAQPWFYIEWTEKERNRPTDLGHQPTSEMRQVFPAETWEESMAAMILYGEDLKRKVDESYKGAKPIRIIPVALAMGWIHHKVVSSEVPGIGKEDFFSWLFSDHVHANTQGAYLVDCCWYAAFHGESPEGKFLPLQTTLTPGETLIMQKLAWDCVKNYPPSGLYEERATPCVAPEISGAPGTIAGITSVTLSSLTPGAWFRYTLDGTIPTRTKGYIYCGVISVRPGMTVKAIAYKSGMANSTVTDKRFPRVAK